jgi:SAM-dependent methyltransferase
VEKNGTTIGWSSAQVAYNNYWAISNCAAQAWSQFQSVLDVGCGEGHFLPFLRKERHFSGQYTGLELLPFFYQKSVEFYGGQEKAEFIEAEFLNYKFSESAKFDWVISLGGLSVKQELQQEYDREFCQKMLGLARYGISIYLNDVKYQKPGRQEQFPNLHFHNMAQFTAMLEQISPTSTVEMTHYPTPTSQNTIVHVLLT